MTSHSIPRSLTSVPIIEIIQEARAEIDRAQLIAVAAQIHAAVILSPKAKGDIKESVAEALALIEMCDKFLNR